MRDDKGRFIKGSKGISKGRKKKVDDKVDKAVFKEVAKLKTVSEKVDYLMTYLLDNAETKSEMFKYMKELLPYHKPKLQNIHSKEERVTSMKIQWVGEKKDPKTVVDIIDKLEE